MNNIQVNQKENQALTNYVVNHLYHYSKKWHDITLNYDANTDKAMSGISDIVKKYDQAKGLSFDEDDSFRELKLDYQIETYPVWVDLLKDDMKFVDEPKARNVLENLELVKDDRKWFQKRGHNAVFGKVNCDDVLKIVERIIGENKINDGLDKRKGSKRNE